MAQGDRSKRLREQHKAAANNASDGSNPENITTDSAQVAVDISSSEEIKTFVHSIQAEIKAGSFDRPAEILSEMLSASGENSRITADDLSMLVRFSGSAGIPAIAEKINTGFREKNPNHPGFTHEQFSNIANIADLDTAAFVQTLTGLVPDEGMEVFYDLAIQDAEQPEIQAERIAAAEDLAIANQENGENDWDIDWLRLAFDNDYQAEKAPQILEALNNAESMQARFSAMGGSFFPLLGQIIGIVLNFLKPMVNNFLLADTTELDESVTAARASQAGREDFESAAVDTSTEQQAVPAGTTVEVKPG